MRYSGRADAISMSLSVICLMHCIILPLFLTSLPLLGLEILENFYLESITILLSFIIGGYAIKNGYLKFHKNKFIVFLFAAGISLMLLSNFIGSSAEIWMKVSGGLIICVAHIQNFTNSKRCSISIKQNCGTSFVSHYNS